MNLDQIRARNAFATAGTAQEGKPRDELLSLARELPATFQRNGLLATWGSLLAKAGPEGRKSPTHQRVLEALVEHFRDPGIDLLGDLPTGTEPAALFERHWLGRSQPLTGFGLRSLTAEAIAYAGWLKRAAEALCDTGKGGAP